MKKTKKINQILFMAFALASILGILTGCQPSVQPSVVLTTAPDVATAGQEITLVWNIESQPGTIQHTAVHYGPDSVTNPKGPSDYPSATEFQCTSTPCNTPGTFSAKLIINTPGIYYYRAHAIINGNNVWSDEIELTVSQTGQESFIAVSSAPDSAAAGEDFKVSWNVNGIESYPITSTSVYYGPTSVSIPINSSNYFYESMDLCSSGSCATPEDFSSNLSIFNEGLFYYRAHASVNGEEIWSDEKKISIGSSNVPVKEYLLKADDGGIYLGDNYIYTIEVQKGTLLNLVFNSVPGRMFHGGVELKGCGQDSGLIKPGESSSIKFTAETGCYLYLSLADAENPKTRIAVQVTGS